MRPTPQIAAGGHARLLGVELSGLDGDPVEASVPVRKDLTQATGVLDPGVYVTLAAAMCAAATAAAPGAQATIIAQQVSILHAVVVGRVTARGRALHRGRTTWVWAVDFVDDEQRLCAVGRLTLALAGPPSGQAHSEQPPGQPHPPPGQPR